MNATQKTLIAIGAVVLLAAGTFGYLAWDAWSGKSEAEEELASAVSTAERLMRNPVRLDNASVRALEANAGAYRDWRTNALAVAGRGDQVFAPVSNGQLKEQMRAQAAKFAALPGGAEGRFVKQGFGFGFKQYVTDGQLPPVKDVPRLQREWFDVAHVVTLLADSGVSEVAEIVVKQDDAAAAGKAQAEKKGAKKPAKKGAKKGAAADDERSPAVTRLSVDFLTAPAGLGAALGAFATNTVRFVTVDDFRFTRESDALAEAVGTEKKQEAAKPAATRRGRRALAAAKKDAKKEAAEEKKTGLAFDPETAPRIKAHVELTVRDFNTRTAVAEETSAEEEAK